eukprot:352911-Chlamydomonas_euryale.AAC.17
MRSGSRFEEPGFQDLESMHHKYGLHACSVPRCALTMWVVGARHAHGVCAGGWAWHIHNTHGTSKARMAHPQHAWHIQSPHGTSTARMAHPKHAWHIQSTHGTSTIRVMRNAMHDLPAARVVGACADPEVGTALLNPA